MSTLPHITDAFQVWCAEHGIALDGVDLVVRASDPGAALRLDLAVTKELASLMPAAGATLNVRLFKMNGVRVRIESLACS